MSASHTRELMLYGEQPILPNTETGFRAIWRFGAPRGSTVPQQHRMVRNARKHSNLLRNSPQDCFSQIRDLEPPGVRLPTTKTGKAGDNSPALPVGGDEGSRTPVLKSVCRIFYGCIPSFRIPLAKRRRTGFWLRYSLLHDKGREKPLFTDAAKRRSLSGRGAPEENGCALRQQLKLYCFCQLIFKLPVVEAVWHRYPLTLGLDPSRNPFIPI